MAWDWYGWFAYEVEADRDTARDAIVAKAAEFGYGDSTRTEAGFTFGPGMLTTTYIGPEVDDIERPAFRFCYNAGNNPRESQDAWAQELQFVVADPAMAGWQQTEPHQG